MLILLFKNLLGLVLFICLFSFGSPLNAQNCEQLESDLKSHIKFLSSDSLRGRATGGAEEKLVNAYLKKVFIATKDHTVSEISYKFLYQGEMLKSKMIACFQNNKHLNTLLVGAHVDHIGMGGELSKSIGKNEVHNGADDNASGVAMLIELQKYFSDISLPFNVLFVAYTGHEIGTKGSEYFAKHWKEKWGNCMAVINFDMLGRLAATELSLFVSTNKPDFFPLVEDNMHFVYDQGERLNSLDTRHFLHLPCLNFSTGIHNDYHKVTDDEEYIFYAGMCQQFMLYQSLIANLDLIESK